jgi:Ca2+-transporting ATPase
MTDSRTNCTAITAPQGLTSEMARRRIADEGYNELPTSQQHSTLAIALNIAREPMFLLLIVSASIYLSLGDLREAIVLALSLLVILGITIFQERKTERALEALRDLSSPRALVIRDGIEQRIAGREVVRGDLLILSEGDRVPADATILSCNDLMVDESLLTGESVPVRKTAWDGVTTTTRPGGDDLPFIYSGTMLVQGRGTAQVSATGGHTEFGKIGKALQTIESDETFLQKKSARMIQAFAAVGLSLCALAVVLYGITRGNWLNGFLVGIALAMSLLPEEIPVILTVFLALGAWRMAQKNVLTRRMPAIESLGAATLLCVDKTGTITVNRMSVSRLWADGEFQDVNGADGNPLAQKFHALVRFAVLASESNPFDPMEKAVQALGNRYLDADSNHDSGTLAHEYSLAPELLAMSHVWQSRDGGAFVIASKGAPEAIADLCHFDDQQRREMAHHVDAMAADGLRVLGVAKASFASSVWPTSQHDFDFTFLGLIGLADPVRPEVPAAIAECHRAGVKVVMITGDYPSTASAIGRQIGLPAVDPIMTGTQIENLQEGDLRRQIVDTAIFARVLPEQKLTLVEAFKANGEIVAMTGDGVNDAPALKAAHIGIAMGGRGTDVARESAALVLLDDNFATIVAAIRAGRRIFDNLQKALGFIFSIHVPIAGLALVPLIFDWPLLLTPVHIVFLELIIDPACSIAFEAEPEEANIMSRPPRAPSAPLFGRRDLFLSLLQGATVLLTVLAVFGLSRAQGYSEAAGRSVTFATLIAGMIGLIFVNRSWTRGVYHALRSPNRPFWWVAGGACGFLAAVIYLPILRGVFRFEPLDPVELGICLVAAVASFLAIQLLKLSRR